VQQSISIGTGTVECFGGDVVIGGHGGHGRHSGDRCLSSCSTDFDGRTGGDENSPKILQVIVGLPSTFASLTVGETKCPAKPSVPARNLYVKPHQKKSS
jgi:hypothetical protein